MTQSEMIKTHVSQRLFLWQESSNEAATRGELARLRHAYGMIPGSDPSVWGILFQNLPEELMSKNEEATYAEWAISLSLCLYALHQQGHDIKSDCMNQKDASFGRAIRKLAPNEESPEFERILKRFNVIAKTTNIKDCAYYLKGIIRLLSTENVALDYESLAYDLYQFQIPNGREKVRLRWGQDFYRSPISTKENT